MMQRRRKNRVLKWAAWTFGPIVLLAVVLAFVQIDDVVMAQGIAEPGEKIYIDSPLSRVISRIYVQPGDTVKAGDPLVLLYDGDLRGNAASLEKQVHQSQANLEVARASLERLREQPTPEQLRIAQSRLDQATITLTAREQDLKRARHLYLGERLWSQEELERAETNFELAQANLRVASENLNIVRNGPTAAEIQEAEAEVRQAEAALGNTQHRLAAAKEALDLATMRSPVDGVVARRDLYPGMLASQGQIVLIIAGASRGTIISAWMSETNAWKVRLGNDVEILSNLFNDRESFLGLGKVTEIYGYAIDEGGARTFTLEVDVVETPIPLSYGSTADLRIIVGRRSILATIFGVESSATVDASRGARPVRVESPSGKVN